MFASDIYSLGVTMFQMLTGVLPYDTPSPADLDRLMRGELVTVAAAQEPEDPEGDQRHRPEGDGADIHARYQRAGELLDDLLAARERRRAGRRGRRRRPTPSADVSVTDDIQARLKARETPQPRFCWHCRKPLHARSDRCPFCGEAQ